MLICNDVLVCAAGSGIEKPIGEAVLQIDMMLGKERKVTVRGETPERDIHKHSSLNPHVLTVSQTQNLIQFLNPGPNSKQTP